MTQQPGAKPLYRDAGSIATSSVANVVLGFAFWAIAAKLIAPEQLGVMTAVLAVIVAPGLVIASGIGDAYTALLPAAGNARTRVYWHGQRVFFISVAIAGVAAALASTAFLTEVRGSVGVAVLVAVGVTVWAAFVLQNSTLAALGRASALPAANVAASLGKILLLPLLVVTVQWHSVELATVLATAVVVLFLRRVILRTLQSTDDLPTAARVSEAKSVREFNRLTVGTVSSVALSHGVLLLSPFLVTAFSGPRQGALFALSLSIVGALDLVGAAMGLSLVVHSSKAPEHIWALARPVLVKTFLLVTIGAVSMAVLAPAGLTLLNSDYGAMGAAGVVAVMCAGSVIRVQYIVWAAIQRARRHMKALLVFNSVTAALFLGAVPAMTGSHGAMGGALALLMAQSVLSAAAAVHMFATHWRDKNRGKDTDEMAKHRRADETETVTCSTTVSETTDTVPWRQAVWVGQVDPADLVGGRLSLQGGKGFRRARLLVWDGDQVRGFVELDVDDGAVNVADLDAAIDGLPEVGDEPEIDFPAISVVLCTKDRPAQLHDALLGITAVDYPQFEVLVVDNNPASGLTRPVVDGFSGEDVRIIDAPAIGLSIARNEGVKDARYDIVAFTDDDVVVDRRWLQRLARGFSRSDGVACVCGMVPSAELLTPAQLYFDRRVGWARRCDVAVYRTSDPPKDDPLFPLRVADYGTGANFAVRRNVVLDLGGFDEGLGVGSPAGGGEDIDMFVRILLAGHALVREPSAVVWHRHRRDVDDLQVQIYNYGLGLGAWISKLLVRPHTLAMVIRRMRAGVRHLGTTTTVDHDADIDADLDGLNRHELNGVWHGPRALLRGRISGRIAKPLRPNGTQNPAAGRVAGDVRLRAARLSIMSVVVSLVGALGAVQDLPRPLLAVVVAVFLLGGPGSLALSWYAHLPAYIVTALVPVVSLAVCLLVVATLLMVNIYSPIWILIGLTSATAMGGVFRTRQLAQHQRTVSFVEAA